MSSLPHALLRPQWPISWPLENAQPRHFESIVLKHVYTLPTCFFHTCIFTCKRNSRSSERRKQYYSSRYLCCSPAILRPEGALNGEANSDVATPATVYRAQLTMIIVVEYNIMFSIYNSCGDLLYLICPPGPWYDKSHSYPVSNISVYNQY